MKPKHSLSISWKNWLSEEKKDDANCITSVKFAAQKHVVCQATGKLLTITQLDLEFFLQKIPSLVHWILLTLGALDTLNSISTGKELETRFQSEKKSIMNEHIVALH